MATTATATATKLPPTDTGRCGEYAGHQRHRGRGEQPCQPCADAAAAYSRTKRIAQRSRPAPAMALPSVFGLHAATNRLHDFRPLTGWGSQCAECWGWPDDPRHPVTAGLVA